MAIGAVVTAISRTGSRPPFSSRCQLLSGGANRLNGPPFEQPLVSTILPDFGGPMTGENTNHFFVEMALGVERAAGRNLGDVHSGLPLHAVEMNKSAATAHAAPETKLQFANILDAKALHDRNAFAPHPLAVAGAIQRSQHFFEFRFHERSL